MKLSILSILFTTSVLAFDADHPVPREYLREDKPAKNARHPLSRTYQNNVRAEQPHYGVPHANKPRSHPMKPRAHSASSNPRTEQPHVAFPHANKPRSHPMKPRAHSASSNPRAEQPAHVAFPHANKPRSHPTKPRAHSGSSNPTRQNPDSNAEDATCAFTCADIEGGELRENGTVPTPGGALTCTEAFAVVAELPAASEQCENSKTLVGASCCVTCAAELIEVSFCLNGNGCDDASFEPDLFFDFGAGDDPTDELDCIACSVEIDAFSQCYEDTYGGGADEDGDGDSGADEDGDSGGDEDGDSGASSAFVAVGSMVLLSSMGVVAVTLF